MKAARFIVACALGSSSCSQSSGADANEMFAGGDTTVFDVSRDAFTQAASNLSAAHADQFFVGNAIFNRGWVTAPASVTSFDGLGPLFNATNCSACHLTDGRGRPPKSDDEPFTSLLLRLSVPGVDALGGPLEDPVYGGQLQDSAVRTIPAEGTPHVTYTERPGAFGDGEPYSLRMPVYTIDQLAYGPLSPSVQISPRVAPSVFGLGLLAALADQTLEAMADPDDRNGDQISGRVNHVWDVTQKALVIGRFGWKANQPSIAQQTAAAFQGDIGITSHAFPGQNCTAQQAQCGAQPSGADVDASNPSAPPVELSDAILASVVSYMHSLAVPGRRNLDHPEVVRGRDVFSAAGCQACHVPLLKTGDLKDFPELSQQTIRPYTDLLLHDMGADLADGRPDFEASGSEWRTPPLWGIGLVSVVNQHQFFLHDGRARGLLEAVLFHGGEATAAREAIRLSPKVDRDALIAFLESL